MYSDFIRQAQKGRYSYVKGVERKVSSVDHATLAQSLLVQMQRIKEVHTESLRDMKQIHSNHFRFEDRRLHKKQKHNPLLLFPIKVLKSQELRGEVFLNDIHEQYPDLNLMVEDLIAIRYEDDILKVKGGNFDILHAIVQGVQGDD